MFIKDGKIMDVDIDDGLAAAVGIWSTKNIGAGLSRYLPGVAATIDRARAGLSTPVLEVVGATVSTWATKRFLPKYRNAVALGSSAIVVSDAISVAFGQVDLVGGAPNFTSLIPGARGGKASVTPAGGSGAALSQAGGLTGALPAPGGNASGVTGVFVPGSATQIGYGRFGL